VTDEASNYEWKDAVLLPSIGAAIALELFDGKSVKRKQLHDGILQHHLAHGGAPPNQGENQLVKNIIRQLETTNSVQRPYYGMYRIGTADDASFEDAEDDSESLASEPVYTIERTLGEGSETVYAYYYPSYRELAELREEPDWPIKIGRTSSDLESRITSQVATTGVPEVPTIALVIRTDHSRWLEQYLHGALGLRRKHLVEAGGQEWFLTSPNEIEELYDFAIAL